MLQTLGEDSVKVNLRTLNKYNIKTPEGKLLIASVLLFRGLLFLSVNE